VRTVPKSIEKYHTVGTVPKSNWKMVEKGKMDNLNTHIHDSRTVPTVWYFSIDFRTVPDSVVFL
jgi:hypothetical protein